MFNFKQFGQSLSQKTLSTLGAGVAAGTMMLGVGGFAQSASALTIAGYDLTGADSLLAQGGALVVPSGGTVANAITDDSVFTSVLSQMPFPNPGEFVTLGFTNNPIVNAGGDDLALFELGNPDVFGVEINGIFNVLPTVFTGETLGISPDRDINVALINLDDFGIASGDSISAVKVTLGLPSSAGSKPDFAFAGAISREVPEPSTMFGLLATVGFFAYQRKQKLFKKA